MIASAQPQTPRIAIVGGGPGGLCLANILLKNNILFTVFESDKTPHDRNQGGTLDIHPAFGQKAIREAGLWDEFVARARPEADVMKIVSQMSGEVMWDGNTTDKVEVHEEDQFNNRPELDREALQEMLLERLIQADCIQWNRRLHEVVPAEDDQYDLLFRDGSSEKGFDIVVGADGAWSRVRQLLTAVKPYYSGITLIEFWANNVAKNNPWVADYIGAGSCFFFAEGRAILAQRIGNGTARIYACIRKPESFYKESGINWEDPESVMRDYWDVYFNDVAEDFKRAVQASTDKIVPRQLFMLPVGFSWPSKLGVTLLGDAAHLMTPFAGVGVNAALSDAYDLGCKIVDFVRNPDNRNIGEVTAAYDKELFPRGEMFAQKTYQGLVGHFSAEGNQHMVEKLRDYSETVKGSRK